MTATYEYRLKGRPTPSRRPGTGPQTYWNLSGLAIKYWLSILREAHTLQFSEVASGRSFAIDRLSQTRYSITIDYVCQLFLARIR